MALSNVDDRVLSRLERSLELMEADYARTVAANPISSVLCKTPTSLI